MPLCMCVYGSIHTYKQTGMPTERDTERQTNIHTYTDRQTDRQTYRQKETDIQTSRGGQTGRQTYNHGGRQTDRHPE